MTVGVLLGSHPNWPYGLIHCVIGHAGVFKDTPDAEVLIDLKAIPELSEVKVSSLSSVGL